ncbi:MAG: MFS transporter [Gracilibacteraceae bacterium]|jgi:predicted MFS family arabinose efflux permease|nr:MFS transporter [Gracilibacteraceae bacterium]
MNDSQQTNRYQNYLLVTFVVMLTATTIALHQFKVPTIMGEIAANLRMTEATAPWLMSIFTFVGIFIALPTGSWVQKFGPKAMLIAAAAFAAAGSLLGSLAATGGVMLVSRGIEGVGFIFATVCGPLAISRFVEPAKMGSAMGIWAIWVPVGQILAFNLTPALFGSMGWHSAWFIYMAASVVMAIAILFLLDNKKGNLPAAGTGGATVKFTEVFAKKNFILLCLTFATFNIVFMGTISFVPTFLESSGLLNKSAAAFVTTLPMFICMISSPIFGSVSDKIQSRKKPLLLAMLVLGPSCAMMFIPNLPVVYAGAAIFGAIGMGVPAMVLSSVGEAVEVPELAGPGMGLMMVLQNVGMFLGTSTFMPLYGLLGGSYTAAGLVLIPVAVLGLVFVLMAKIK